MPEEIGASIASSIGNIIGNEIAYRRQRQLNQQRYTDYVSAMRGAGATPAAVVQGLTGSGAGSMPVTSTSNNPVYDVGATMNNAVSADAAQRQAGAAESEAEAAKTKAETERQLGLMKLRLEPMKYFADVRKALSEAFMNTKHAFLHGSMKAYYDELTKDVVQVRPWKIASLRQGLLNDMATFNKIVQETATSKAQAGYYNAASYEAYTRGDLNKAEEGESYARTLNENLKGFRLQWENTLLAAGIDPTKSFWQNTASLMLTNPRLFRDRMNMFVSSLNILDNKLQLNLGEHYKRNIMLGIGAYKLNQLHQKNANSRAYRGEKAASVISKFIPFLNPGSIPSVGESGPGVDWWLKD